MVDCTEVSGTLFQNPDHASECLLGGLPPCAESYPRWPLQSPPKSWHQYCKSWTAIWKVSLNCLSLSLFQILEHMNGVDGSCHLLIVPKHEGHSKLKYTISAELSHLFSKISSPSLQNLWQSNPDQTFIKSKFGSGGQICSLLIWIRSFKKAYGQSRRRDLQLNKDEFRIENPASRSTMGFNSQITYLGLWPVQVQRCWSFLFCGSV